MSRSAINEHALRVLYRLKDAGYASHLVGGCVRDLLLGREPKDFDVTTDAHPEQVKELFRRNCRLIGRRFRLAHVQFGREIIEVATFRARHDGDEEGGVIAGGRILRDNVYGSIEEDAFRRDFTVNALYYDIRDFSVVDYVGGVDDLKQGTLRLIGDPETRYREDPVRMLRAVRFAAKLGFRIHPDSEAPIFELAPLLQDISPSRLFEEVLKLFQGGCAVQTFELLRHYGLFAQLFPATEARLAGEQEGYPLTLLVRALGNTDKRILEDKPVTPAFMFAALLWEPLRLQARQLQQKGDSEGMALQQAMRQVLGEAGRQVTIPKRFSLRTREIWTLQPRLNRNHGKRALRLLQHPAFRAAYDFLLLRAECGEIDEELAGWWTRIQEVSEHEQLAMCMPQNKQHRRRRRSSRGKSSQGISHRSGSAGNGSAPNGTQRDGRD